MQVAAYRRLGDERGEELTAAEKDFADAFIGPAQGDAVRAAQAAGYASSSHGYQVLQRRQVRQYIDLRLAELVETDAALTPLEIHRIWRKLAYDPDPNVALRATENVAKTHGMFTTKTEQTITVKQQSTDITLAQLAGMEAIFAELPADVLDALIFLLQAKKDKKSIDVTVFKQLVNEAAEIVADAEG